MSHQALAAPRTLAVDLYGYGQIGRALIPRLEQAGIPLASIHDSKGVRAALPVPDARRVWVDATAPRYEGDAAESWVGRLEAALEGGTSLVTCNKAPLALAWGRLASAAERGGSTIAMSGTVGGGTPVLRFLHRLHLAYGVVRIEAGLSGTLSFVLDRVARGATLEVAVRQAQRAGFAEPDPTLDLDGTDAYAKAVIVHNRLFPGLDPLSIADRRQGLSLREEDVGQIVARGLAPQVVAAIAPNQVGLELVGRAREDVLLAPAGYATVTAWTRDGRTHRLVGPGAGAAVTAGTLVGDLQAVGDRGPGQGWGLLP